jgi:coenzyme F420 hydrogenase subunit beta
MSGLCSGCGVCTALCPTGARTMVFDEQGGMFLPRPDLPSCTGCGICLKVCPFTPANPPTPTLTQRLYAAVPGVQHHDVLGYYLATHVGYSEAHRLTSASGGLATWLLEHLLSEGAVDAVLSVGPDAASPTLFNYRACRSALEVRACSGSCYQPVHLGRVLGDVLRTEGRYAVVALPCVARALRLATVEDPRLRSRLVFVVGLVCGQMKSRHYAEYLCARCGGAWPPTRIAFRTKRPDRPASDYAYTLSWDGVGTEARTAEVGWTDGLDMA